MTERRTLAIDIGGTGLKAALLDDTGHMVSERSRADTPAAPLPPEDLARALDAVIAPLGAFDRVSVGFPGAVRDGRILTAPHYGTELWHGFDLQSALSERWGKPVRVLNDADIQGYGAIQGEGLEMVLTLGTGAGTALFRNGELMPHLELAHHPIRGGKTYNEYVGRAALERKGKRAWNKRVARVIAVLRSLVNFDRLYIGGGNAAKLVLELPGDVSIVPNSDGLTGGIALWRSEEAAATGEPEARAKESKRLRLETPAGENAPSELSEAEPSEAKRPSRRSRKATRQLEIDAGAADATQGADAAAPEKSSAPAPDSTGAATLPTIFPAEEDKPKEQSGTLV